MVQRCSNLIDKIKANITILTKACITILTCMLDFLMLVLYYLRRFYKCYQYNNNLWSLKSQSLSRRFLVQFVFLKYEILKKKQPQKCIVCTHSWYSNDVITMRTVSFQLWSRHFVKTTNQNYAIGINGQVDVDGASVGATAGFNVTHQYCNVPCTTGHCNKHGTSCVSCRWNSQSHCRPLHCEPNW